MSREMMTTKEAAGYLNLNEKKVYALVKSGKIPCTKVTGKWIFPRNLIDRWIRGDVQTAEVRAETGDVIVTGSHDLSIEVLASEVSRELPERILLSANLGSLGGLMALRQGRCHIAGAHLLHPETNEYNFPYLPQYLPKLETVVVNVVHREQGLMVQPGNPLGISGFEDLCRSEVRFINRQQGAGTRVLLDHNLKRLGLCEDRIKGYDSQVSTHTEVAMAVRSNRSDTGLGVRAAALAFGLEFIPITKERFDFIIPKPVFYTETVQKLLELLRSESFARRVERMGGYDLSNSGRVLAWQ